MFVLVAIGLYKLHRVLKPCCVMVCVTSAEIQDDSHGAEFRANVSSNSYRRDSSTYSDCQHDIV